MKIFKNTQLISVSKLVLIALTIVFVSCSNNEDAATIEEQSITAANFTSITSYSNEHTNIQFGDVVNNSFQPIIKVENYNDSYNYSIVLKGDHLDNEYKVDLTFDETINERDTNLKFDMAAFDAAPDTYQAYIFEEESNTEIKIDNKPNQGERNYYVYDADHAEYLYNLSFKKSDSNNNIPSKIYKSKSFYIDYPHSPNYSFGLDLELVVYDANFNELGKVDIHTTLGSGYTNEVYGSDLSFITQGGDYIFQTKGTPKVAGGEYTARKSTFKTMTVSLE